MKDQATSIRNPLDVAARILFETRTAYACAGLSPLTFPYVLIVAKRHFRSLANSDSKERRDLIESLSVLRRSGLFPSGKLDFFEHGDICPQPNTECLDHCHLHVMDGGLDLTEEFLKARPEAVQLSISETVPLSLSENYLLAGCYSGGIQLDVLTTSNPSCGRQYFRRLIAHTLELSEWDWRKVLNEDMVNKLIMLWGQNEQIPK